MFIQKAQSQCYEKKICKNEPFLRCQHLEVNGRAETMHSRAFHGHDAACLKSRSSSYFQDGWDLSRQRKMGLVLQNMSHAQWFRHVIFNLWSRYVSIRKSWQIALEGLRRLQHLINTQRRRKPWTVSKCFRSMVKWSVYRKCGTTYLERHFKIQNPRTGKNCRNE